MYLFAVQLSAVEGLFTFPGHLTALNNRVIKAWLILWVGFPSFSLSLNQSIVRKLQLVLQGQQWQQWYCNTSCKKPL